MLLVLDLRLTHANVRPMCNEVWNSDEFLESTGILLDTLQRVPKLYLDDIAGITNDAQKSPDMIPWNLKCGHALTQWRLIGLIPEQFLLPVPWLSRRLHCFLESFSNRLLDPGVLEIGIALGEVLARGC